MLTLILGRAKSGKTAAVMDELRRFVEQKESPLVLLVPEQYSHEAERELLRRCGDGMSRYAEVLSFTRLASRVEQELGRRPGAWLDQGGRLLCMALAVEAVGSRLRLYGAARRQTQLQSALLSALDEMTAQSLTPEQLRVHAAQAPGVLRDKLEDLALVAEAYTAVLGRSRLDPTRRLDALAENIGRSELAGGRFYLDGFTDFTRQELAVIDALLQAGAEVTVTLSTPGFEETLEIFEASRRAAVALRRRAESLGADCCVRRLSGPDTESPMAVVERELFRFSPVQAENTGAVVLRRAPTLAAECEAAAAECLALVRSGCRWRDIAVAVRGYDAYRGVLESVFARYGVPIYAAAKTALNGKPLFELIRGAFEVVGGGWDYDDVFAYLKTGLAGLNTEDGDELENYVFLWSLRGSAWTREGDWRLHPQGYNAPYTDETNEQLRRINALRRRAAEPLAAFARAGKEARTAQEQAEALTGLLAALELPATLQRRAEELEGLGLRRQAAEYQQLWDILTGALEQCVSILGDMPMEQAAFGKLFLLVLSQYDVGTIPLSLDKVSVGDMDRARRRGVRHLLVLGCDSVHVPLITPGGGIFSDDDRDVLLAGGLDLGNSAAQRLSHEFALIYHALTLPDESLYLSYCAAGGEGEALPSFVMERLSALFSCPVKPVDVDLARLSARRPAFDLAARQQGKGAGVAGQAAWQVFAQKGGEELERIRAAAALTRGQLSRRAVRTLYGSTLRLSASRVDKFASCRFAYFMQYGLNARPRQAAAFAPPERGTFMHDVLERVAKDVQAMGGFPQVSDETVAELCDRHTEAYIHQELNDFQEKSPRFVYLFRRLLVSVRHVVLDMAHELQQSRFQPLSFELDFGDPQVMPPLELGEGEERMVLTGIADRVDGWLHDGKLYLRVVDYKTGRKDFSLADVWYGKDLQMLLYLFTLEKEGAALYGRPVTGAGVLYMPARDLPQPVSQFPTPEEIEGEKARARRRKGLLLADPEVLNAMEPGLAQQYIPVSLNKSGQLSSQSLATAEQLGALSRHIDKTLCGMARELHRGSILADPYFRSRTDSACRFCDYRGACHFDEDSDEPRYLSSLRPAQVWELVEKGDV